MYEHRTIVVRKEARAALLAYAFLRGKTYRSCEAMTETLPNWKRVEELVVKYCKDITAIYYYRFKAVNKMTDQQYNYVVSDQYRKDIMDRFQKWKE